MFGFITILLANLVGRMQSDTTDLRKEIGLIIRQAKKTDASSLALLIDAAGYGIPSFFWSKMKADGQTTMECGTAQTALEEGAFSYSHAWVADIDGQAVGALAGYVPNEKNVPENMRLMPDFLRPIIELEIASIGTWYINAIATAPEFQCRGIASKMLEHAAALAREAGADTLSLVVNSNNSHARLVYEREGFLDYDIREVIAPPGVNIFGEWILMKKVLS